MKREANNNEPPSTKERQTVVISLIVAAAENNVIGHNNRLPWHLPADMKYFKNKTWGSPVVMGRKTFEALGKPLPGRTNIVITRNTTWAFEKVQVAHSLADAIALAQATGAAEIFVIGGAEIFQNTMSQANRIYLTRIHHQFEGDAFFPPFAREEWQLVKQHSYEPDEKDRYGYTFEVWERNGAAS